MIKKTLPEIYMQDLKLHTNITPNGYTINKDFEADILQKIKAYTVQPNDNVIFCDFINKNFDLVIITQLGYLLKIFYWKNAQELQTYTLELTDTNDKYKQYYNLDFSCLPDDLTSVIQKNNNNTNKTTLTAHRTLAGLKYNISGLEVHHIDYTRFNPDGVLERLKTTLDINLLLPCTRDFHIGILHNYINDCITETDIQTLTEVSLDCKKALDTYVSTPSTPYKFSNDKETIYNILVDYYKNNMNVHQLHLKYQCSRQAIFNILHTYKPLINWL